MHKRILASALMASVLAACGGGGGASSVPSVSGSGGGTGTMVITLHVPGANNAQVRSLRHPLYTSRDTQGIGVEVQAHNPLGFSGAPGTTPTFASALTAGSNGCGTPNADGSFTCTMNIGGLTVGYDDFRVALWNVAPTGGTFSSTPAVAMPAILSANTLLNQAIKSGQNNTFGFTFLPVVDSVQVSYSAGIVDGTLQSVGNANPITVSIIAKDADGNIILGTDHFIDASMNPIALTPSIVGNIASSLSMTPGAPSFTTGGGSGNTFSLNYDGAQQFSSTAPPSINVAATGGSLAGSVSGGTIGVTQTGSGNVPIGAVPQVAALATSLASAPLSLALDPVSSDRWIAAGGNILVSPGSGSGSAGSAVGNVTNIAFGNDRNLYYTDSAHKTVGWFAQGSPATVTESAALTNAPTGVTYGPDGNIYVSDAGDNKIYQYAPGFAASAAAANTINGLTASSGVSAIIAGPLFGVTNFPSVCFLEPDTVQGKIGCLDTSALTVDTQTNVSTRPYSLALGPDGLIYVGETGKIQSFDLTTGVLVLNTTYPLASSSAQVTGITLGGDGNLWFVESNVVAGTLGRLAIGSSVIGSTPAKAVQEWSTGTNASFETESTPALNGIIAIPGSTELDFIDATSNTLWSVTP